MLKALRILLFLLVPVSAFAQNDRAGDAIVAKCWENNLTHVKVGYCVREASASMKETLAAEYERVRLAAVQQEHLFMQRKSQQFEGLEARVVKSQKTFWQYVKAECGRTAAEYGADNGSSEGYAGCEMNLMQDRIDTLNHSIIR